MLCKANITRRRRLTAEAIGVDTNLQQIKIYGTSTNRQLDVADIYMIMSALKKVSATRPTCTWRLTATNVKVDAQIEQRPLRQPHLTVQLPSLIPRCYPTRRPHYLIALSTLSVSLDGMSRRSKPNSRRVSGQQFCRCCSCCSSCRHNKRLHIQCRSFERLAIFTSPAGADSRLLRADRRSRRAAASIGRLSTH